MASKKQAGYALDQSPFYRLTSKRKLAALLELPLRDLRFLIALADNYRAWDLPQKRQDVLAGMPAKKERKIQQPKPLLGAIHKRIAVLLSRIQKPRFVYSATRGVSYADNARRHMNSDRGIKVDIKDFYQTIRPKQVRDFFEYELKCAPDIAHLLSQICCVNNSLPTGSALSPILSYFACSRMFSQIASQAESRNLVFTLYVDDMMFSGEEATRDFSAVIVRVLAGHGFIGHKISYFPPGTAKVITGVAVWADRVSLPRRRYRKMRLFQKAFWRTNTFDEAQLLGNTLIGQFREAERLHPGSKKHAKPIEDRLDLMKISLFGSLTQVPVKTKRSRKAINIKRAGAAFIEMRKMRKKKPQNTSAHLVSTTQQP